MGGLRPLQVTAGGGREGSGSSTLLGFLMGPHESSVLVAQAGLGISIFKISQVIKMNLRPRLEPLAHPWTSYHSIKWGTSLMGCSQERVSASWSLPCCSLGCRSVSGALPGAHRAFGKETEWLCPPCPPRPRVCLRSSHHLAICLPYPKAFFSHLLDLYYFPGAAVTNYHKPRGLKQQKLLSHNSGD